MMLTALITRNYHKYQLPILIMEGQELYFILLAVASQAVRFKQRCRWHPLDQSSNLNSHDLPLFFSFFFFLTMEDTLFFF